MDAIIDSIIPYSAHIIEDLAVVQEIYERTKPHSKLRWLAAATVSEYLAKPSPPSKAWTRDSQALLNNVHFAKDFLQVPMERKQRMKDEYDIIALDDGYTDCFFHSHVPCQPCRR